MSTAWPIVDVKSWSPQREKSQTWGGLWCVWPLPASPLPALFSQGFVVMVPRPAPGLGAPRRLPTCPHPSPPRTLPRQQAPPSLPVQAAAPAWKQLAPYHVSRSQVNRHPHPSSQGVVWVGLRGELKRRRQPACEPRGTVQQPETGPAPVLDEAVGGLLGLGLSSRQAPLPGAGQGWLGS